MTKPESQKRVWYIQGGVPGFDLSTLPKCKATAKSFGRRCRNPAMKGTDLCCVHAGIKKPGAKMGNTNAFKHGMYSRESVREKKSVDEYVKEIEDYLDGLLA